MSVLITDEVAKALDDVLAILEDESVKRARHVDVIDHYRALRYALSHPDPAAMREPNCQHADILSRVALTYCQHTCPESGPHEATCQDVSAVLAKDHADWHNTERMVYGRPGERVVVFVHIRPEICKECGEIDCDHFENEDCVEVAVGPVRVSTDIACAPENACGGCKK